MPAASVVSAAAPDTTHVRRSRTDNGGLYLKQTVMPSCDLKEMGGKRVSIFSSGSRACSLRFHRAQPQRIRRTNLAAVYCKQVWTSARQDHRHLWQCQDDIQTATAETPASDTSNAS